MNEGGKLTRTLRNRLHGHDKKSSLVAALDRTVRGIAALIGMATQVGVNGWYSGAEKPLFNPPDWLFPIVWSLLYATLALVGVELWLKRDVLGRVPFFIFAVQLLLNWSWSFLFFRLQWLAVSFIVILGIIALSVTFVVRIAGQARLSVILLIPYILWTAFAALLSLRIWQLN